MKNANMLIVLVGALTSLVAVTCLAQSFMNFGSTPNTSSTAPRMTQNGTMSSMSADDFKSRVTNLGKQNQENLAQQVQSMLPPPGGGPSNSGTTSTESSSNLTSSSSQSVSANQPTMAAPTTTPAPRNNYSGFGAGSAPASSGSSSGSGGFGIKY